VGSRICIKYNCLPDLPCQPAVVNVPPDGQSFTAYPPPSDCQGCELKVTLFSVISQKPNDTPDCGITACDEFTMVVNDECNGGSGGGGGGIGSGSGGGGGQALEYTVDFDAFRVNVGFEDDDNDRVSATGAPANNPGMRLDRFLTGDTLRNELKISVTAGNLEAVNYRLFFESLTSDFGVQDGDAYDMFLGNATELFANRDTTELLGSRVIIKKANGQTHTCDLPIPMIRSDEHLIPIAEPNTQPPAIVDVMVSMFDQFDFKLSDYIQNNCLPNGFVITAGDVVTFQNDYKFTNNFTPIGGSEPPLINFRTSVCDLTKVYSWELGNFCSDKPLLQYSGFLEEFTAPVQTINPCEVSTEERPFKYDIRIARENMFPFEVRPISSVTSYTYGLPTNVDLLDTRLLALKLQENDIRFSDVALTPTNNGNTISLDLNQFFNKPLDEGYSFEISTKFDTTCGYDGTKFGRFTVGLDYANECIHSPVSDEHSEENENGYISGSPELVLSNINPDVVNILDANLELNFTIRNNSPVIAYNSWLIIESDNNLDDVELFLVDPPNLIPVTSIGGVYQLGDLAEFGQPFFRIKAKSRSCGPFTITYRFGWGCTPTLNGQANTCGEFTGTVEIRPEEAELELGISSNEPNSVPLCAPSADFEFTITNADDGTAYNIDPTVKLPPGFVVEPGTSRLTYPAVGGVTKFMADPQQLAGNIWLFDPSSAPQPNPLINNGLPGDPLGVNNRMRITFRVRAECGAVAGAKFIYGAEAVQPCGISSNRLRRPGGPIGINGVNSANNTQPSLSFTNPTAATSCDALLELEATINLNGAVVGTGDSIYVTLPVGTSYEPNSYAPGNNAPGNQPLVRGLQLIWPFPDNLATNAIMNFKFKIRYNDPSACFDQFISIQTREKTSAFCGSTQCDVYVATGEYLLPLGSQNPDLLLSNFQLQTSSSGQLGFTATLDNEGVFAANNPVVIIYHDVNGNGQVDAGDTKVETVTYNGVLNGGTSAGISGNLNIPPSAYCDLIAVIPADENCACDDVIIPLDGNQVVTESLGFCDVQSVNLSTDLVAGNTYVWQTTDGITCTSPECNNATYVPGPGVVSGDLVTLILIETSGSCTIERRFNIQFGSPATENIEETICQGLSLSLTGPEGAIQYQWTGPGLSNTTQQNQVITPTNSGVYEVVATFNGNCKGTKTYKVTVLSAPDEFATLSTCEGNPIEIFSDDPVLETDVAGDYTRNYFTADGCEFTKTVTLLVSNTNAMEHRILCEGDSTKYNDNWIKVAGMYCQTGLPSSIPGCDSTHCLEVTLVPKPNVPKQDTLIVQANAEITLNGPSGFNSYDWSPKGEDIEDPTQEDPIVTPDSSTTFVLIVKDNNGCPDTVQYRVFTCDVLDLLNNRMPNAFSPNGDGSNDTFKPAIKKEAAEKVVSLQIFDRWGTKVYEGNGASAAWDGTYKGKPAASDVYVYIVVGECNGFEYKRSGEVTLLR
jgi:gliding motility-associated-like protein